MIRFLIDDKKINEALCELVSELPAAKELDISVSFERSDVEKGLAVRKNGNNWCVSYTDNASLMRGVALAVQSAYEGKSEEICETPLFGTLGIMLDVSGNAVMKPSALRRYCRLMAVLGYNTLVLKTVNGSCITADADMESFAGRYSAEELRELDSYAKALGITLVPCVQFSELPLFNGAEELGGVIDNILSVLSENLTGRRICFGFDRPPFPGCGPYPTPVGNCPEEDLPKYMEVICDLCKKYGYEITVGSGVLDCSEAYDDVTYAVSECTSVKCDDYRALLRSLSEKTQNVGFVGGDNSWYGAVPLSWLSHTVACNTLPALKELPPKEVYIAVWRDDTGAAPFFSTLPVLFAYAETCYAHTDYTEHLSRRMLALCGVDFYDMVPLEDIPAIRCRMNTGRIIVNPAKYMLYDDIIDGAFAAHSTGARRHLRCMTEWMAERIERSGEFAYIFEAQVAFCDLLACKYEISEGFRREYKNKDRAAMQKTCDVRFDRAIDAVDRFAQKLRAQWEIECMDFGMELIEERLELVKSRIAKGKAPIADYLSGKTDKMDFYESEAKPYAHEEGLIHDRNAILINDFEAIIKGNN